ncbi:hypothetical protein DAEQUDRAFT_723785 [Daedalea quercina L-15889]|uniref:cAMP-independent regulatory protein pac2 n=1 Tax=Daedalea quercina L-15889 TaxID=1314783 RepID=A0A165S9V6_9APHY|nr:hypothetical protein DAEQUDRAFT_723785 [Daedalea quercina L-15889]
MPPRPGSQMPTCQGVRVLDIEEARIVMHAVSLGRRPMIHDRLREDERWSIMPGSVFVWEERDEHDDPNGSAISRWTDGRRWGPSRVKDEFLIYHENLPDLPAGTSEAQASEFAASKLIKQTYSAFVDVNGRRKKWHLGERPRGTFAPHARSRRRRRPPPVAYYTKNTDKRLTRVFNAPELAHYRGRFSPDRYMNARVSKTRGRSNSNRSEEGDGDDSDMGNEPPDAPPHAPHGAAPGPSNAAGPAPPNAGFATPDAGPADSAAQPPSQRGGAAAQDPGTALQGTRAALAASRSASEASSTARSRGPHQAPSEGDGRGPGDGGEFALAPLVYDRISPYPPRHPVDSVALRSLDVRVRFF